MLMWCTKLWFSSTFTFLLCGSGKTSRDFQRHFNVFTDFAEDSCVVRVDLWWHSSDANQTHVFFQRRFSNTSLKGLPWMMPFEGAKFLHHVACHGNPSAQLAVHVTQKLEHARVYALPLGELEGNSMRNTVKSFAPVDRHAQQIRSHQPVRIPQTARYPPTSSARLLDLQPCNACRVSPVLANVLNHESTSKPTTCI